MKGDEAVLIEFNCIVEQKINKKIGKIRWLMAENYEFYILIDDWIIMKHIHASNEPQKQCLSCN